MTGEPDETTKPPSIGQSGGAFFDAVFARLPPSAGIGLAGIGAFLIAWQAIPKDFVGTPKIVLEWGFTAAILLCSIAIVIGVFRRA